MEKELDYFLDNKSGNINDDLNFLLDDSENYLLCNKSENKNGLNFLLDDPENINDDLSYLFNCKHIINSKFVLDTQNKKYYFKKYCPEPKLHLFLDVFPKEIQEHIILKINYEKILVLEKELIIPKFDDIFWKNKFEYDIDVYGIHNVMKKTFVKNKSIYINMTLKNEKYWIRNFYMESYLFFTNNIELLNKFHISIGRDLPNIRGCFSGRLLPKTLGVDNVCDFIDRVINAPAILGSVLLLDNVEKIEEICEGFNILPKIINYRLDDTFLNWFLSPDFHSHRPLWNIFVKIMDRQHIYNLINENVNIDELSDGQKEVIFSEISSDFVISGCILNCSINDISKQIGNSSGDNYLINVSLAKDDYEIYKKNINARKQYSGENFIDLIDDLKISIIYDNSKIISSLIEDNPSDQLLWFLASSGYLPEHFFIGLVESLNNEEFSKFYTYYNSFRNTHPSQTVCEKICHKQMKILIKDPRTSFL